MSQTTTSNGHLSYVSTSSTSVITTTGTGPGPPITTGDVLSLTDQINDMGAGVLPLQERPERPTPLTPSDPSGDYATKRETMEKRLQALLNKCAKNGPFCSHPEAVVYISIDAENHN